MKKVNYYFEGVPEINQILPKKSWILNLSYIVSVESGNANDIKINMANDQVVTIELGRDYDASKLLDELLDLSAEGLDYNVYKINSFEKKY